MVQDRLRDGKRIAQLLASELTGDHATLAHVVVADADPDVEPTDDGAVAYRVVHVADDDALATDDRGRPTLAADPASEADAETTEIATVYVQPARARVEFAVAPDRAAEAAGDTELRVRPKAVEPPRTLVFIESGVDAKRVLPVFEAVFEELSADGA
ncbi:hypothetical protein EGH24_07145 [Halonotius terrestris]|uniref:DUF7993 domain-containing protein n=1 Tax=Halonotius terrestris TaxID=2487750 RepID=A0A8J8P990_9EURY|nr:hypothetical protein [Halonotius terrestris]TQQ80925.1 hypothetical protein EGH24_07145 [Halonotius terrestris]